MTKFLIVPLLVLSLSTAYSQQQKKYFDAPFGGGVGYVPAWYIPNIDPVNSELKGIGLPELSNSGMYSSGVAGFIYIGFVKYLRVGGMGFGGSSSTSKMIAGKNKEIIYSLSGGGLSIEYTLPFVRDIGLSVGAVIGNGTMKVEQYSNSGDFSWAVSWEDFNSDNNESFSRSLENNYWMITPTANLDIPLNRFILIRIGAGYQFAIFEDWTSDNDQPLKNVPSDLNANSFFVQSGIYIGFFSF
jgi:hypothetical protein